MKNQIVKLLVLLIVGLYTVTGFCDYTEKLKVSDDTTRILKKQGDASVDLYLDKDAKNPWLQKYKQSNEPTKDYCGPTAIMNMLYWYDSQIDSDRKKAYETLGKESKTNSWAKKNEFKDECKKNACAVNTKKVSSLTGGLIRPVTVSSDACVNSCNDALRKWAVRGTLPKYMKKGMEKYTPKGMKVYLSTKDDNIEKIILALSEGNPVAVLVSTEQMMLHWATIVGVFRDGDANKWMFRINNMPQKTVDEDTFRTWWSLKRVHGNKQFRSVLHQVGVTPYAMVYYGKKKAPKWEYQFKKSGSCNLKACKKALKKKSDTKAKSEFMFAYANKNGDKCECSFKDKSEDDNKKEN